MSKVGYWSFVVGLILATVISIFASFGVSALLVFVLALLGLIVGLANITDKEVKLFLIASIAFLMSFQSLGAVFGVLALGWEAVSVFFYMMAVFIAPAAAIVALKALYNLSKD